MNDLQDWWYEFQCISEKLEVKQIRNEAICRNCLTLVRSMSQHHWVPCKCYTDTHEITSEYERKKKAEDPNWERDREFWHFCDKTLRGFFLDGGDAYQHFGGNIGDMLFTGHMKPAEVESLLEALKNER